MQGDFFQGLRFWVKPTGETIIEGDVKVASRFVGLSRDSVLDLIEEGEIEARQPGANRRTPEGTDNRGRKLGYKYLVNMRDVFRIAYGEEVAAAKMRELGLE